MINATRSLAFPAILVTLGLVLLACSTPSTDSNSSPGADLTPGAGPTQAQPTRVPPSPPPPSLPDLGPAPDFTNEVWINTDRPLTLDQLRGKVVLVEFWTFG
jgi:hypothetical protein